MKTYLYLFFMPGYVHFIYHLADGKRVWLLDNYYLYQSKVTLAYEIPQEIECSASFGSEVLHIFVRTDKFEQTQTQQMDGYDYLKEDLKTFIVSTRYMKAAKPKTMQRKQGLLLPR